MIFASFNNPVTTEGSAHPAKSGSRGTEGQLTCGQNWYGTISICVLSLGFTSQKVRVENQTA